MDRLGSFFVLLLAIVTFSSLGYCQFRRNYASVLFIGDKYIGSTMMRGTEVSSRWPGRSRVINCKEFHQIGDEEYDLAVHIIHGCKEAMHSPLVKRHIWDVVDGYMLKQWDWPWNGAIVGTRAMKRDFCSNSTYDCEIIPHLVNNNCAKHASVPPTGTGIIGVTGTSDRIEQDALDALYILFGNRILEEKSLCRTFTRSVFRSLQKYTPFETNYDDTSSCSHYASCEQMWNVMEIGIVWHKDASELLDTDLRYKPCTRLATLAHLNIPAIVHAGYSCVDDLLGEEAKHQVAVTSYEEMANKIYKLPEITKTPSYWQVLTHIRRQTSAPVVMSAYDAFFQKVCS